jgi:hypothetical protein
VIDEPFILTVGWMLSYFHMRNDEERQTALGHLKYLLEVKNVRLATGSTCELDCDIQKAIKQGHPAAEWLTLLLELLTNKAEIGDLDDWEEWTSTKPLPYPNIM